MERPALNPLPAQPYPFVAWKTAKVNIDYHIEVDRHFYSVPYQLVGNQVDVWTGNIGIRASPAGDGNIQERG